MLFRSREVVPIPSSQCLLDEADSPSVPIISRITRDDPAGATGSAAGVWPVGVWPVGGRTPKAAAAGILGEEVTPTAVVVAATEAVAEATADWVGGARPASAKKSTGIKVRLGIRAFGSGRSEESESWSGESMEASGTTWGTASGNSWRRALETFFFKNPQ